MLCTMARWAGLLKSVCQVWTDLKQQWNCALSEWPDKSVPQLTLHTAHSTNGSATRSHLCKPLTTLSHSNMKPFPCLCQMWHRGFHSSSAAVGLRPDQADYGTREAEHCCLELIYTICYSIMKCDILWKKSGEQGVFAFGKKGRKKQREKFKCLSKGCDYTTVITVEVGISWLVLQSHLRAFPS